MNLPGSITPRDARRAVALGTLAALSSCGLALAALDAGPFAPPQASSARATPERSFSISIGPATRMVLPGATASYAVRIHLHGRRRMVRLRIVSHLPAGVRSAIVRASRTRPSERRLVLRTSATTRPGTYRVRLRAYRRRARARGRTSAVRWSATTRTLRLVVAAADAPLTVGGEPTLTLTPGTTSPVDMRVGNPGTRPVRVSALSVSVTLIRAPHAGQARTCSLQDFAVRPYNGASFVLPARAELKLSDLGSPVSQWPQLMMLNRALNQDGCQGATLQLAFSASGWQIR